MEIRPILPIKIIIVLFLFFFSSYACAKQGSGEKITTSGAMEKNALRCETMYSQVTYSVYTGLFISHQASGEVIQIGDSGDVPLECTNDGQWLIYYDKGTIRYDKAMEDREIVDLWRIELNSKRRAKFATADLNDILMLNGAIFAPKGSRLFLGRSVDESQPMEKPKWEIVGSKGDWRSSSAVWLNDGSALISSTWDAELKSDILVVEQFTPDKKNFRVGLDIDNFIIKSVSKDNKLRLKVWGDDSVEAKGTIDCVLDIEQEKATCKKIDAYDKNKDSAGGLENFDNKTHKIKFAPYVKEYDGTFYFKLKSGGYLKLVTTLGCVGWNSCRWYEFVNYYIDKGFFLLRVSFGEGTDYILISDKTGEQFYIESNPVISPDRNYLLAVSGRSNFNINGVFIWRIEDEKVISEFSFNDEHISGSYTFVGWKDQHTTLLHRVDRADKAYCLQARTMTVPVTLKREDGEWKFIDDLSGVVCKNLWPGSPAYEELKLEESFGEYFNNEDNVLSLRLGSDVYKELTDTENCSNGNHCAPYHLVDYFKNIGFYFVCDGYFQCKDYLLISDRTGKEYRTKEKFVFSPDKSFFFTVREPFDFSRSEIIFWKFNGDELIMIDPVNFDEEIDYPSYRFISWKENSTILLSATKYEYPGICPYATSMVFPATLKIDKNGWSIVEDRSTESVRCE